MLKRHQAEPQHRGYVRQALGREEGPEIRGPARLARPSGRLHRPVLRGPRQLAKIAEVRGGQPPTGGSQRGTRQGRDRFPNCG